ncbi:hypothetical protein [Pedobacter sp.]
MYWILLLILGLILFAYVPDFFAKKTSEKWVNPDIAIKDFINVVATPVEGIARKKTSLKYDIEDIFKCWEIYLTALTATELKSLEASLRLIYTQKNFFVNDDIAENINKIYLNHETSQGHVELESFYKQLKINELNDEFSSLIHRLHNNI